ncbi:hypothetical protein [Rhizobium sp. 1399]|uniref:hypothetical protein n=1 Tax=Rhizobium sp. 1399 TaxID=2817758 RepID=UPI002866EA01|nr:hypothetical protein [Rhizobium sp. 1399]MDR6670217.1 hypothetical protein [Rhizobium sp. 1399]
MNLVFGYEADGRVFPDADSAAGMLDKAIVGPLGLVQMIETQVGLLGPQVSNAARIATYATKLRVTGNGRFWAESYAKDPWTTASTLLDWRDGLVAGGWKGGEAGVARVDDLATAETASPPLPAGISDRAAALIDAVPNRPGLRIRHLMLVEPRALLPVLWQRLIAILEQAGVIVSEEDPGVSSAQPGSDLFKVQNALAGGSLEPLCGDGTFTIVEADTELMAAEVVADWLAASPLEDLDGTVILEPTGDTSLLDHGLRARDVPALGLSAASPWRGALQVLPLAFAAAWRPFDPRVLLDLLLLPRPPIDGWAASLLSRALSTEPGIGGRAWRQAWDKIETRLVERFTAKDAASAQKKTETVLEDWRAWTETDSFDRRHGMPLADARAICGRVVVWHLTVRMRPFFS